MELTYRQFNISEEDAAGLFRLYERVYGSAERLTRRWRWEYLGHPRREEIVILVAQAGDRVVASTSRLPIEVRIGGEVVPAFFCVDSMVDPDWRGQGIMRALYRLATTRRPLLYSKGTAEEMLPLLESLGNRQVIPNTVQVTLLAPVKWLFWKARLLPGQGGDYVAPTVGKKGFNPVVSFGPEFDEFWTRAAQSLPGAVVKDAAYMNWRYVDVPYRHYSIYYREKGDRVVAMVVLSTVGRTAYLVDILWDGHEPDEPATILRFSKKVMRGSGAVKMVAWGTLGALRQALSTSGFVERAETPHFSVYGSGAGLAEGSRFHFVHGDGDLEFL